MQAAEAKLELHDQAKLVLGSYPFCELRYTKSLRPKHVCSLCGKDALAERRLTAEEAAEAQLELHERTELVNGSYPFCEPCCIRSLMPKHVCSLCGQQKSCK